jgi:hypothetical protein
LFLIGGAAVAVMGQSSWDARIQSQLKQLFPSATAFSPKESQPPHFKAYLTDSISRRQTLEGLAFWTHQDPRRNGHEGDPHGHHRDRGTTNRTATSRSNCRNSPCSSMARTSATRSRSAQTSTRCRERLSASRVRRAPSETAALADVAGVVTGSTRASTGTLS